MDRGYETLNETRQTAKHHDEDAQVLVQEGDVPSKKSSSRQSQKTLVRLIFWLPAPGIRVALSLLRRPTPWNDGGVSRSNQG